MEAADDVEAFERAVEAARCATTQYDRDALRSILQTVASSDPGAVQAAVLRLSSGDSVLRAAACELIGIVCEYDDDARKRCLSPLLDLVAAESDADVLSSAARALGATAQERAVPALCALALHPNPRVRLRVAVALPSCTVEDGEPAVDALVGLTCDSDAEVRNWATFGLGRQLNFDSAALRDALWGRVTDASRDVREEAIAGLARRRDRRALPLVAEVLESGDVPTWFFEAAAALAEASLVRHCSSTARQTRALRSRSPGVTRCAEPNRSATSSSSSTRRSGS